MFCVVGTIAFILTLVTIICICRGKPKKPEKTQAQAAPLETQERPLKDQYVGVDVLPQLDTPTQELQVKNGMEVNRGISMNKTDITDIQPSVLNVDPSKFKTYQEIQQYMDEERKMRNKMNNL